MSKMNKKLFGISLIWLIRLWIVLVIFVGQFSTVSHAKAENPCSPGTLLNPYTRVCASINDVRYLFTAERRSATFQSLPNLSELRNENTSVRGLEADDMPVPGGVGAGINYKNGSLKALEHAELHTKMFVYPNGLNPSADMNWLMTPATNRTDNPVEVVGIYAGWQAHGSLGVFGRSCSEAYPCPNGETENGWQWFLRFSEINCNMTEIVDKGGHQQKIIQYANKSEKLDQEDPPLWRNSVYLWNFCTEEWDLFYEHQYRENKRDCSLDNITCAWWGPILEFFGDDPQPEINELGFEDTLLYHDGTWNTLSPSETTFRNPISPWILFHLDPNRGYGAGNYFVENEPPTAPTTPATSDGSGVCFIAQIADSRIPWRSLSITSCYNVLFNLTCRFFRCQPN